MNKIIAYIISWPLKDDYGNVIYDDRFWGDYTPEGIAELKKAVSKGAIIRAFYEDETKVPIDPSEIDSLVDPAPEPIPVVIIN